MTANVEHVFLVADALGLGRRLNYRPDEAAKILRLGRRQTYEHIHAGRLKAVRNGNRLLVPVTAIANFIEGKTPAGAGGGR
ncbi:MAG TPA: helix-turn-helix domain-containing protein [Meiothermus sp.]|nr:helix-turn-helix domain-containing protein [Meiothermus sp.]